MHTTSLNEKFNEISKLVEKLEFRDIALGDEFKSNYKTYLNEYTPAGYKSVDWAEYSAKITTTTNKILIVPNFWFFLAKELSAYLAGLDQHKNLFSKIFSDEPLAVASTRLRSNIEASDRAKITNYFSSHNIETIKIDSFIDFISNYDSWGGGKTIDRNDFFVSALMKAGNLLAESQSAVAEIARQFNQNSTLSTSFNYKFINKKTPNPNPSLNTSKTQSHTLPKPFLLLAGISGTGKSRFVRQQARPDQSNYQLVAVRPDWHEPSDLLGYVSRLSGTAEYVATPVLRFIVKAWQELLDKGCTLPDENRTLDDVLLSGTCEQLDAVLPYWLCLDEMNLAPVEQYFADYLALIETRKWEWPDNADGFEYSCDALLAASTLTALEDDAQKKLAAELGLEKESKLWKHFLQHGIAIPPNLIVAGTVNMDETTHGFSRKVIDRAMSFDFGEFFPNDFADFYTGSISQVPLTFPRYSSGSEALDATKAQSSIEFLQAINAVLKNTPFELAYRALNELLLAVHCHGASDNDADLQAVWDDFLMQKVLPRIEGDADKLQQNNQGNLLSRLQKELETQLVEIWADDKTRTDFYRMQNDAPMQIPCRSRQKIQWMQQRLESSGFTSFWP